MSRRHACAVLISLVTPVGLLECARWVGPDGASAATVAEASLEADRIGLNVQGPVATIVEPRGAAMEQTATAEVDEGKRLLVKKCQRCHTLDRIKKRRETKEGWTKIVKRMQGKKKRWISDDEASKIIAYLVATYGK